MGSREACLVVPILGLLRFVYHSCYSRCNKHALEGRESPTTLCNGVRSHRGTEAGPETPKAWLSTSTQISYTLPRHVSRGETEPCPCLMIVPVLVCLRSTLALCRDVSVFSSSCMFTSLHAPPTLPTTSASRAHSRLEAPGDKPPPPGLTNEPAAHRRSSTWHCRPCLALPRVTSPRLDSQCHHSPAGADRANWQLLQDGGGTFLWAWTGLLSVPSHQRVRVVGPPANGHHQPPPVLTSLASGRTWPS